jgi:hypothetical protein
MVKNDPQFTDYIGSLTQRIDWLITACSGNMLARETAREHLLSSIKSILTEVYNYGYISGEKDASFHYDQRYRVMKYKTKEKVSKENKTDRKELLDMILKEYGLVDDKINNKLRKKIINETKMEESI